MSEETPRTSHIVVKQDQVKTPHIAVRKRRSLYGIIEDIAGAQQQPETEDLCYGERLNKELKEWMVALKQKGLDVFQLGRDVKSETVPEYPKVLLSPEKQRYLDAATNFEKFFEDGKQFREDVQLMRDLQYALVEEQDQTRGLLESVVNKKSNCIAHINL